MPSGGEVCRPHYLIAPCAFCYFSLDLISNHLPQQPMALHVSELGGFRLVSIEPAVQMVPVHWGPLSIPRILSGHCLLVEVSLFTVSMGLFPTGRPGAPTGICGGQEGRGQEARVPEEPAAGSDLSPHCRARAPAGHVKELVDKQGWPPVTHPSEQEWGHVCLPMTRSPFCQGPGSPAGLRRLWVHEGSPGTCGEGDCCCPERLGRKGN